VRALRARPCGPPDVHRSPRTMREAPLASNAISEVSRARARADPPRTPGRRPRARLRQRGVGRRVCDFQPVSSAIARTRWLRASVTGVTEEREAPAGWQEARRRCCRIKVIGSSTIRRERVETARFPRIARPDAAPPRCPSGHGCRAADRRGARSRAAAPRLTQ
jgi:hypothetical protein